MLDHEKGFDEAEQREIIGLAARLQREEGDRLSSHDLIQVAAEAGIEPVYVQKAIDKLQKSKTKQPTIENLGTIQAVVSVLLVAQWLGIFSMLTDSLNAWKGLQFWLLFSMCFALGAVLSKTAKTRWLAVATSMLSAVLVLVLCGNFVKLIDGQVNPAWPDFYRNLVLAEALATLLGGAAGKLIERLLKREARSVPQA
jgi:hypothetical protein